MIRVIMHPIFKTIFKTAMNNAAYLLLLKNAWNDLYKMFSYSYTYYIEFLLLPFINISNTTFHTSTKKVHNFILSNLFHFLRFFVYFLSIS